MQALGDISWLWWNIGNMALALKPEKLRMKSGGAYAPPNHVGSKPKSTHDCLLVPPVCKDSHMM